MMKIKVITVFLIGLMNFLLSCSHSTPTPPQSSTSLIENKAYKFSALVQKPLKAREWSVSGVSSGAMMSTQLSLIHSEKIKGVGIFSGTLYGCSEGNIERSLKICMASPDKIDTHLIYKYIQSQSLAKKIDPFKNIENQKVFIVHGRKDSRIMLSAQEKNKELYENLNAKVQIKIIDNLAHGVPTLSTGWPCDKIEKPWINNCDYDTVGELFQFLYPIPKTSHTPNKPTSKKEFIKIPKELLEKNLHLYNLTSLLSEKELREATFHPQVHIYVPEVCKQQSCSAHIAIHGCKQSPSNIDTEFLENAGYLEAAERHQTIIVFPSIYPSEKNPYGCWDWWGYTDQKFDTYEGPQIKVLKKIIDSF